MSRMDDAKFEELAAAIYDGAPYDFPATQADEMSAEARRARDSESRLLARVAKLEEALTGLLAQNEAMGFRHSSAEEFARGVLARRALENHPKEPKE